ncbi:vWA domain-containing protein [Helicobacter suis]|uniref:vWA domain-containing protein n=1 Tax=Helicobacter suis TaxID=104628 RepID=UPI0013CF94B0|nr:VWA domain-containing protein [Helicobacter suis]
MAFNPNNYVVEERFIPIFLLLDTSTSMGTGMKGGQTRIECLNTCVQTMIDLLKEEAKRENVSKLAVITFGAGGVKLHTRLSKIESVQFSPLGTGGRTPLGAALKLTRDYIQDKDTFPDKFYTPYVVMVSDGEPKDNWKDPLYDFINNKKNRSSKSVRYSVFIGDKGKEPQAIHDFSGSPNQVYYANDVQSLINCFKAITASVTQGRKITIKDDRSGGSTNNQGGLSGLDDPNNFKI